MPQGFVNPDDRQAVARRLGLVSAEAGRLLAGLAERSVGHRSKQDGSPTTAADQASERLIVDRLAAAWPGVPIVAEEGGAEPHPDGRFFLVDPLDGTRDFLTGTGEYAVCIALIEAGRPVAAAVAAPDCGQVFVAGETAEMAALAAEPVWRPIRVRPLPQGGATVLVSRRHGDDATEACLDRLPVAERKTCSSAYKFCLIAAGAADLYIRCGPTMEWDTAAGDHLVACAGGRMVGSDGAPLLYGGCRNDYRNGPFAAAGDTALLRRVRLPQS